MYVEPLIVDEFNVVVDLLPGNTVGVEFRISVSLPGGFSSNMGR